MIREIKTYSERNKIFEENELVGETTETENQFNIWRCQLLKNKISGEYSIFLTADSDEQWAILTFD
jgi:hypothetical protein